MGQADTDIGVADLTAAAELGGLLAEHDEATRYARALTVLHSTFRADAVAVTTVDAVGGAACLARSSYEDAHVAALAEVFPVSPWMSLVLDAELPPSLSREDPSTYRDGWFYREHLAPAGFRDGLTGALRLPGGVGLVHLSSGQEASFNDARRAVLAAMLPTLSKLFARGADQGCCQVLLRRGRDAQRGRGDATRLSGAPTAPVSTQRWQVALVELVPSGSWVRGWVGLPSGWQRVEAIGESDAVLLRMEEAAPHLPHRLTGREVDVLTGVACGLTDSAIAERLHVSVRTVHTHQERIRQRLGLPRRSAVAALAHREGIVRLDGPLGAEAIAACLQVPIAS